ncbi:pilus assembly PilX N-terminal domain-containing protein [Rheinheimera texasensis]|uniref:pilus assembly PilX family protein n=1 Tax=Rheinheimera texasensis TaxID=306205 RepID=UPI0032B1D0A7
MHHSAKGSVLIVALMLLLITTLVSVAGITNMQTNEKLAANNKQVSEAFLAAESGMIQIKTLLDDEDNAALWGDSPATLAAINAQNRDLGNMVQWQIESVDYVTVPGFAAIVSIGTVTTTGVQRKIAATYKPKKASGNLGAMNIIGGIKIFDTANSNSFQIIGEKDSAGNLIGPALATNTDANYDMIVDDINDKGRMANYIGGVKVVDFDDPFGDPEKMNQFIESIKAEYNALPLASRGTAPNNMGTPATRDANGNITVPAVEKITYVSGNLEFKGQAKGAGILVIEGNLTISGNLLEYEGLIVVRGQSFQMNGGGNRELLGSIVFANPIKDATTGEWAFGKAEATFVFDINGGGNATFEYNEDTLVKARNLLSDNSAAKQLWQVGSGTGGKGGAAISSMMNWVEVH